MRFVSVILVAMTLAVPSFCQNVVLQNGIIVDGAAKPRVAGDIRIQDGKIVDIGSFKIQPGDVTIDIQGMVVAPGFIDIHNHSTAGLAAKPDAASQIMQGITTIALGADGTGPVDVAGFIKSVEANPPALNVLTFVGHDSVRRQVMGTAYKRAATPQEIERMSDLVSKAMNEGAFGLSSGLDHDAGLYAASDEMIALAKAAAKFGGIYMTEMRDDGNNVLTSLQDSINVGRVAKSPVEISHLRLITSSVWGQTNEVLAEFDKAHAEGIDVTADIYPYDSYPMPISRLLPGGKFTTTGAAADAIADIGGANNILFVHEPRHPDYAFKTLADVARARKIAPSTLVAQVMRDGGADVVCSSISDRDIRSFIRSRWVMIASDGGLDVAHPRSGGTFPRVISEYVNAENLLPIELAIAKMTSVPATRLGIKDRGTLRKGAFADIVVFDPEAIHDTSTFQNPFAAPQGIKYVFVNGTMVVKDGQPTGQRPGTVLRQKPGDFR